MRWFSRRNRIPRKMKLSCLMPTYGRPTLVQNSIACFMAQDYPAELRRLLILDDADQISPQDGDGWCLRTSSVRMPTLVSKYVILEAIDGGWADAFVIWDDDDIYLPWHLTAHANVLQQAQWSHPKMVWSLDGDGPKLVSTGGGFWASAAVRRDLQSRINGFIPSARGGFDQAHLSTWRKHGGEPGRPEPPSYVYGWGRAKHCSLLMASANDTAWYSRHQMTESGRVERLVPRMDAQTLSIYAALTAPT
jgi:hypothetical protein